jgi:hypothetical protein
MNLEPDAAPGSKEHGYAVHEVTVLSSATEPLAALNTDLHRGLKARQISMIALGGAIGSEFTINSIFHLMITVLTCCFQSVSSLVLAQLSLKLDLPLSS